MSVKEFAEKVRSAAQDILGPEYYVEAAEILKINGIKRWSVSIHSKNGNVSPIIYMESYYADYEEGKSFGDIMNEIIKVYWESVPKVDYDFEKLLEYDNVKTKICMKLCNKDKNPVLLKDVVYISFNDLAVLFYIELDDTSMGYGHVLIKDVYLKEWGIKTDELVKIAMENTMKRYPAKIVTMKELFDSYFINRPPYSNMFKETDIEYSRYGFGMMDEVCSNLYILTNNRTFNGSSCMLYPKVIEDFSNEKESNIFIIPSSVHELILLPEDMVDFREADWQDKVSELKGMIAYVNDSELSPSDFLSYNLYYYDRNDKNIRAV